jgi:homoserine O-acetyltransferase
VKVALPLVLAAFACARPPQIADLGDVRLASGEVLRDCRIGYRTFGKLDARRANAVLLIPWLMGSSSGLAAHVGPGKLVDSSRDYVIAVDVPGNGVASSPSNSKEQPEGQFPRMTIGDLVETQYLLLTRALGIAHLKAVVGISLGGLQVFQWAVAHPGFADGAVSIAGTPRTIPANRERWEALSRKLHEESGWKRLLRVLRSGSGALDELRLDPFDFGVQTAAIGSFDVSVQFGGSLERVAALVRGRMLVVVSTRDDIVDPEAAKEFARLAGAGILELDGRCGHFATVCEEKALRSEVWRFLGGL